MLGPKLRPWSLGASSWTCRSCSGRLNQRVPTQLSNYATRARQPRQSRRRLWLGIAGGTVGVVGLVNYTEGGQFAYNAVRRSGRVVGILLVCINDYRRTLNKRVELNDEQYSETLKACHKRCAERTLHGMETNGSIFIKLGQHLSSLNYLLPGEWCDTFVPLQDHCPVSSFESIKAMIEGDTRQRFEDIFDEFEEQPLGAASLAQVHLAVDKQSGQHVAVKVQHPTLDDWGPLDLALTKFTFRTLKRAFPEYDLTWLSDEMEVSLPQELDFAREGQNALRAKEYFSHIPALPLVIPNVLWARRRILVMEYITGHRHDDLAYLDRHHISRDEVSASLARIFNTMIFAANAPLHCDPHGGNIAIRHNAARTTSSHNFEIILYDHGLYRDIPSDVRLNYAKLWLAVLDTDEPAMRTAAFDLAGITDEQFPLFASAITGREYTVVTRGISQPHSQAEKEAISHALGDGLLQQLVQLLGKVPRIILLILKTNDLTRSLDAGLHTRQGPVRSFLILASFAAKAVYEDTLAGLTRAGGLLWWPPRNAGFAVAAWIRYVKVEVRLGVYEWYLFLRGCVGLENPAPEMGL